MSHLQSRRSITPGWKDSISSMVDMVFLLLIYFVVTYDPQDKFAQIDIADRKDSATSSPAVSVLNIALDEEGFELNGKLLTGAQLGDTLKTLASYNYEQGVVIQCPSTSLHGQLIAAMDYCHHAALTNISIITVDSI